MKTALEVKNKFESVRDCYGMVTHNGAVVDNGPLYTAHYAIALHKSDVNSPADISTMNKEQIRLVDILNRLQLEPGLMMRTPANDGGLEQHDNLIGDATISFLFDNGLTARRILYYGNKRRWLLKRYYDNTKSNKFKLKAWLGRYLGSFTHIKFCAGLSLNIWDQIKWAATVASATLKSTDNRDAYLLTWHMVYVAENNALSSWLMKATAKFWRNRLKARGYTVEKILAEYFEGARLNFTGYINE